MKLHLGKLTGESGSFAADINARGQIVGYSATEDSETRPVLWTK